MALDSERAWREGRATGMRWLAGGLAGFPVASMLLALWRRVQQLALVRYFTSSLVRRILVSNLIGLAFLIGGILWVTQQHALLITAKRESLKIQGEIVAAAIAANASVDRGGLRFDPNRLPEVEGPRAPFRDDGFAALELSLHPEKVGPVLRRLIQPSYNTRARIYDREGNLVVDSANAPGRQRPASVEPYAGPKPRVRTLWSKLIAWIDGSDLPVYHEIGAANGTYYQEVRIALAGSPPQPMLLLNEDGQQIVSLALPIQRSNSTLGALLLSTQPGEIDRILSRERWIILTLAAIAFLTTFFTSFMLARTIAGPVKRLSAAADQVSQSINARAELPEFAGREDEVGRMAVAFRRMTTALFRRIEASEKFAADVAHELKNPLTAARSTAESLIYAKTQAQRDQQVQQIREELKRLDKLISDVANASRLDAELARQITEPVDLAHVLTGVSTVLGDLDAADGLSVVVDIPSHAAAGGGLVVRGHEGRLSQVITNLLDNAISFSPPGGKVVVRARRVGEIAEFAVEDDGPGMPENKLDQIFERFYSDRPASDSIRGKNSGLGLSISREIIAAHGGQVWAENRRDTANGRVIGARFVVQLPALGVQRINRSAGAGRGDDRRV